MTSVPSVISELVERFERNYDTYRSGKYNETQLRREYLDPFFKALGWDIDNQAGLAERYKDVVHEDSIKIDGDSASKAPDYCFRIGGTRKFFVEAKSPTFPLSDNKEAAFQIRRYSFSVKLPISILTNFHEFVVHDCSFKPYKDDDPKKSRILLLDYKKYADEWEKISGVFSRDAILMGAFDKYAESTKGKKGTAEVDGEILKEIEGWREELAHNIARKNHGLSVEELNFAVARTIDRILFLRVCEDRGVEPDDQLKQLLRRGGVYQRLLVLFRSADLRYNSGLFHFQEEPGRSESPDLLTPRLVIDDIQLRGIISSTYYPECPYVWKVIPADILGQVYEQFLGKVIRLTKGHQAKVEDKPEVKKAGGVYYTPTYIVDYIVQHTVGKLLEQKTPKEAAKLRILDPACGSGSFLIGAYQHLLDWYLEAYLKSITPPIPPASRGELESPPVYGGTKGGSGRVGTKGGSALSQADKKRAAELPIYQAARGAWRLSLAERKRILLDHIYGVDIDGQAVEVTKLSLLLKVLEGETQDTLESELKLRIRALPDLGANIKCGNSLIGTDFYSDHPDLSEDERRRINPFDWHEEFKAVFKQGGFDAVIGNPPYVRQETLGHQFKDYARSKFEVYNGIADLYTYFIEQSHRLLRTGGRFGMICSNKWMRSNYGGPVRNFIAEKTTIEELVDFGGLGVFKTAITYPVIILTASRRVEKQNFIYAPVKRLNFESLRKEVSTIGLRLDERAISGSNWALSDSGVLNIIEKMKAVGIPLGEYVNNQIYRGILTGLNEAFVIDGDTRKRLVNADKKSATLIKPFAMGRDVKRYGELGFSYLILLPKGWTARTQKNINAPEKWLEKTYPALYEHLSNYRAKAIKRQDQGDYWWELRACEYYNVFEKPKIVFPTIQNRSHFTIDRDGVYSNDKTTIIATVDNYLLGLINSLLLDFFLKQIASTKQGGFYEYKPMYISQLPIRTIDFSDKKDKARHDKMVSLVEKMLELNKDLPKARTDVEQTRLKRQIAATDKQIDQLVYELYGLTEDEIRIVEGAEKA
jgi:hypothetical protein